MVGLLALAVFGGIAWAYLARPSPYEAFRAEVEAAPGCVTAQDCRVLQTPCPLGCAHAVPVSSYDALAEAAARYVAQSRKQDGLCAQDCLLPPLVICEAGRCAFSQ